MRNPPEDRFRRHPRSGVTLVEVLVALSIVAVMASAAVLTVRPGPSETAEEEARKLAARLAFAIDEALSTGTSLRFEPSPEGYRFTRFRADGWREAAIPSLAARTLPRGIAFAEDLFVRLIDADATSTPFTLTLRGDDAAWRVRFDGLNAVVEGG